MTLYPAFLDLAGLRVVVVGGGPIAASKLDGLVAAGASLTVVAPGIVDAIRLRDGVTLVERAFRPSDLDGARWVVAAATPDVNREVAVAAAVRGLFVNAVDDKHSAAHSFNHAAPHPAPRTMFAREEEGAEGATRRALLELSIRLFW